jgi:flavin reductase (DIM6/NTAB) family NADH-FMN oxidoreductase RutF
MTVTDYAGVSVDPPLLLVCADKTSNTFEVIREGRCFAINLLSTAQVDLSNRFASKKLEAVRFDGLDCERAVTGAPLIPGAVASFDCSLEAEHEAGDHVIFVGRIEHAVVRDLEPLVYVSGRYGRLAPVGG